MDSRKSHPFSGTVAILLAVLLVWSTEAASAQGVAPPASEIPEILADRNESGISDFLEARLEAAPPGERFDVVVTFRPPGGLARAQQAVGVFELRREFQLINGFAATMSGAQILGLSRVPGILRIEEDVQVTTQMDAARRDFGVEAAWSQFGVDGTGTVICVVDTGVDRNHEQFSGKTLYFFDAVNGQSLAYDDNGHGTHVAAIAAGGGTGGSNAGIFRGVAPEADIYAAKVLSSSGSGSLSQVIAGVEWCAGMPEVHIINMRLGTAGGSDGGDALSQAVNAAVLKEEKIVVVAAGNSGDGPESVGSPGAAEHAVTVGAVAEWSAPVGTDRHSMGVYLMAFSSRGPTLDGRVKPDIVAPGATIRSARAGTVNGYVTYSGTSMATPFVAGALALALDANPWLTALQAKFLLEETAQDRGPEDKDTDWGSGLLDVAELVAGAAELVGAEPTPFPTSQRVLGSVGDNGFWNHSFYVDGDTLDVPIGATVTIEGRVSCSLFFLGFCWAWEWSPDLDARLRDPAGNILSTSECPAYGECAGVGRQETLRAMPTGPGWYTIEVWPYSGSPNNGKGGVFALELSTGPLADFVPEPDPEPDPEPVDNPPAVSIVHPADGSTVTGWVTVEVVATDEEDAWGTLVVEVSVAGGPWQPAVFDPSSERYMLGWDSEPFGDGASVRIDARATDSGGSVATVDPVTVIVSVDDPEPEPEPEPDPEPDPTPEYIRVGGLTGTSAVRNRNHWRATVEILVVNNLDGVVPGASVIGRWSEGSSRNVECTTGDTGTCSITSSNIGVSAGSVTFTVLDVGHASLPYQADGETSIVVNSP